MSKYNYVTRVLHINKLCQICSIMPKVDNTLMFLDLYLITHTYFHTFSLPNSQARSRGVFLALFIRQGLDWCCSNISDWERKWRKWYHLMHYVHALTCQSSQHILWVCADVLSLNRGEEHTIGLVRPLFRSVFIVFDGVVLMRSGLNMGYMTGRSVCMSVICLCIH